MPVWPKNAACLILSATCLLPAAPAVSFESLLEVMQSCAAQADDPARLQCYDRGVARFQEAANAAGSDAHCSDTGPSAPRVSSKSVAVTQSTPAPDPSDTTDRFGLTSGQVLRKDANGERTPPPPEQMRARIVTLSHRPGGALVLRLDNSQVWEQTDAGPNLRIAAGDPVIIDRGLLGAYWLSGQSRRGAIKVRRTQ